MRNARHVKDILGKRKLSWLSPMERIAIDVLGPLPKTDAGNQYILVAQDYFTKWPKAFALTDQQAFTVADVLVNQFFTWFGIPMELHSDQGRNFKSETLQEVCRLLGISKTRTTPYHPSPFGPTCSLVEPNTFLGILQGCRRAPYVLDEVLFASKDK